jgi:hypothetical protein
MSSSKLINVNKVQENLFKNHNYAYNEKMCLSYKISFNYITYFSSEYKKTTKTCSFIIEYKDNNLIKYGIINYYLSDV